MAVTKLASECPAPQVYSGLLLIADARTTPGNIPHSMDLGQGNQSSVLEDWNENAMRLDLTGRFGGGSFGICHGLAVSAGTGLQAAIAAGQGMINGLVERTATTVVLAAASTNWIWLKTDGTVVKETTTTPPAGACTCLGAAITDGSAVTSVETSGAVYLKNGFPERETADVGTPTDSPSASWRGFTKTTNGYYFWNGVEHIPLKPTRKVVNFASDANKTLTQAEYSNQSIEFTGTLGAGRDAIIPVTFRGPVTVYNNTTGGFAVTVKTPSGTGIAVAATKRAILESDGTNIVRITADA